MKKKLESKGRINGFSLNLELDVGFANELGLGVLISHSFLHF